jgi:tripartite-type tricarboxylate transporter receptor subunit TctC
MIFLHKHDAISQLVQPGKRMKLALHCTAAALTLIASIAGAAYAAEQYPTKSVRFIVPYPPGGGSDITGRAIGVKLNESLGQTFVIDNRPGATGLIGTQLAARAPADGYTLLLGGAVNAVNATLYEKLNFNFIDDTAPVAGVVRFPNVMTVAASFPAKTVPEFIAYAKANPGRINHGSSGNGTTQHLAGELFKIMTGVEFAHVPYRGASQALIDLLGGQVQVLFEPLPASIPHIKSGALRALAVTTVTRSEALPDVPTMGEFVAGYEASGWTGLCAPKGTPADVIARLNTVTNAGLADPRIKARFAELGATTLAGSPAEFGKLIASETEKWGRVIRAANIRLA